MVLKVGAAGRLGITVTRHTLCAVKRSRLRAVHFSILQGDVCQSRHRKYSSKHPDISEKEDLEEGNSHNVSVLVAKLVSSMESSMVLLFDQQYRLANHVGKRGRPCCGHKVRADRSLDHILT